MAMSSFLFAYGTLQPGLAPPPMAPLVARMEIVATASITGTLYNLGQYPGAVLDPNSPHSIHGTVLRLPRHPDVLPLLDAYEDYDPQCPAASQFVRVLHPVTLDDGRAFLCWIYVCNHPPDNAPAILSGRFEVRPEPRALTTVNCGLRTTSREP